MASTAYSYSPDFVFPPGETLRELLEARSIKQVELAEKLDMSQKAVSQLINGRSALTHETALKLQRVLGVRASFWNNLEAQYQEHLEREREAERLEKEREFLKEFPLREMEKRGWIEKAQGSVDRLRNLLDFFGVASPAAWEKHWGGRKLAMFRQTDAHEVNWPSVAAWLRRGEILGEERELATYSSSRFGSALHAARDLAATMPDDFSSRLISLCAEAGVAVVLLPQLPKTGISGATRWFHGAPLVQLTLRYTYADFFWFAFFHEAAHILLHGKTDQFWEGITPESDAARQKEDEANAWATDFLIPREAWEGYVSGRSAFYARDISAFAQEVGVHPGLVVGRLQHEKRMDYRFNNDLRIKLQW